MAEERDTPENETRDTSWDEAVDTVVAAATPNGDLARAPRFSSPLLDAYSVALSTINGEVRAPDPRVERQLPPIDAIARSPLVELVAGTGGDHSGWYGHSDFAKWIGC